MSTATAVPLSSTVTSAWLAEIEAEIVASAAVLSGHRARLLRLVGQFDAAGGWVATGAISCAHWLANLIDIEVSTAREHVRVAKALRQLPRVRQRFESGSISYAKVRHLTRVATPDNEDELVDLAARHPAGQLGYALSGWQHQHDPDALRQRQIDGRGVSFRTDPSGNVVITIVLPPEDAAEVEALIDGEVLRLPSDGASAGVPGMRPTLAQQRADGFRRLVARRSDADASVDASASSPTARRVELVLHRRVGQTELDDGTRLHPRVARLLTCDADVRVMTHYPDGSPADVGRRHRLVTPRLRRLVFERAGGRCEHPGCRARHFLEVHHIVHWDDGGRTDLINLRLLCDHHHRWAHDHETPPPATPAPIFSQRET